MKKIIIQKGYNKKIIESIFIVSYAILLLSRLAVISGNYNINLNPVFIEVIYIAVLGSCCIAFSSFQVKLEKSNRTFRFAVILLTSYVFLFGIVFVNPVLKSFTNSLFSIQSMFLIIVFITVLMIKKFQLFDVFLKVSFFITSMFLVFQLLTNMSDLDLSNIANALNGTTRTRVNFGFGHYNTLGSTCAYNIIIWFLIKKRGNVKQLTNFICYIFILISVIMLLLSASRAAITGLILYGLIYIFISSDRMSSNKQVLILIRMSIVIGVVFLFLYTSNDITMDDLLNSSNRSTLIEVALPTLFKSGRTFMGLGYAANEIYGTHVTPYTTYWLDNSYIYTLITTGYIGCSIYGSLLIIIAKRIFRSVNCDISKHMICIYIVYLYTSLFEVTFFNGGIISNYFYVILILVYISNYFEKEKTFEIKT